MTGRRKAACNRHASEGACDQDRGSRGQAYGRQVREACFPGRLVHAPAIPALGRPAADRQDHGRRRLRRIGRLRSSLRPPPAGSARASISVPPIERAIARRSPASPSKSKASTCVWPKAATSPSSQTSHRHADKPPWRWPPPLHLAQPQGTLAGPHRAREHRINALRRRCSTAKTALCPEFSHPGRAESERASRRSCAGPRRPARRAAADDGALARIDPSRRCRRPPPSPGGANGPAPICAASACGRPPSLSTTVRARASGACRRSTSISTINAAAAPLPAAPRSTP